MRTSTPSMPAPGRAAGHAPSRGFLATLSKVLPGRRLKAVMRRGGAARGRDAAASEWHETTMESPCL
jgi:hypothetical protein